jgi:hypothetical protein
MTAQSHEVGAAAQLGVGLAIPILICVFWSLQRCAAE